MAGDNNPEADPDRPDLDRVDRCEQQPSEDEASTLRARTAAATEKAREAVESAATGAKDVAVGAFDAVIEALDSLGKRRD
ncbi:MAG: hypothetical protein JO147_05365 [Actinobacteria bacterium]|nr:hypothetical protein [Actinomycetota bacterium]